MALRTEIVVDDTDYLWWSGDGTKEWSNKGTFSISLGGDGYFKGTLSAGKSFGGMQSPIFGNTGLIATADSVSSTSGGKRIVHVNLLYANEGTQSTAVNENLSAVVVLERGLSTFTELTRFTVNGTTSSVSVGGGNYLVSCKLNGAITFTDNNTITNAYYRVRINSHTGTWPRTIAGSQGMQRLGVCSYIP